MSVLTVAIGCGAAAAEPPSEDAATTESVVAICKAAESDFLKLSFIASMLDARSIATKRFEAMSRGGADPLIAARKHAQGTLENAERARKRNEIYPQLYADARCAQSFLALVEVLDGPSSEAAKEMVATASARKSAQEREAAQRYVDDQATVAAIKVREAETIAQQAEEEEKARAQRLRESFDILGLRLGAPAGTVAEAIAIESKVSKFYEASLHKSAPTVRSGISVTYMDSEKVKGDITVAFSYGPSPAVILMQRRHTYPRDRAPLVTTFKENLKQKYGNDASGDWSGTEFIWKRAPSKDGGLTYRCNNFFQRFDAEALASDPSGGFRPPVSALARPASESSSSGVDDCGPWMIVIITLADDPAFVSSFVQVVGDASAIMASIDRAQLAIVARTAAEREAELKKGSSIQTKF